MSSEEKPMCPWRLRYKDGTLSDVQHECVAVFPLKDVAALLYVMDGREYELKQEHRLFGRLSIGEVSFPADGITWAFADYGDEPKMMAKVHR